MGLKERRKREKNERRKQILDAARALLFEKGIKDAAIGRIAKKAELGVGTIYFYYKSKEEIFAALQQEGLAILTENIRKICQTEKNPVLRLKKIAGAYLLFSKEHKNYFDIINYFLSSPDQMFPPEIKSGIDLQGSKTLALVARAIETLTFSGDYRTVDTKRQAVMFWGMLHGLLQIRKLESTVLEGEDYDDFFDYCVQSFIDGLKIYHAE